MQVCSDARSRTADHDAVPSLNKLVMGVHWSPPAKRADAADLDALCVVYDAQRRVLDVIHGGRLRNENESIVHTGDSYDGASHWDDERIFVFADALPGPVARVALVVACADGRAFHEIPGAVCHVTDEVNDHEWLRLDLSALRGQRIHTVATLHRVGGAWSLAAEPDEAAGAMLAERRCPAPDATDKGRS